jgi:hypothetical protein
MVRRAKNLRIGKDRGGEKEKIWFYRLLRWVNILLDIGIIIAKSGLLIPILGIVITNTFVIEVNNS